MKKTLIGTLAATAGSVALVVTMASAQAEADRIKPTKLPEGPPIAGPHLVGKTIIDGDVELKVPGKLVFLLGAADDGYAVIVRRNGGWTTQVVAEGRGPRLIAKRSSPDQVVLSGDGGILAITTSANRRRTVIEARLTSTSDVIEKETFAGYPRVLDVEDSRAIVGGFDTGAVEWDLSDGTTSAITGRPTYFADISANRLAYFTKDPYLGGCSILTRVDKPRSTLWRSCREAVREVSPNGQRIATTHKLSDGLGPNRVQERTARGALLGTYDAPYYFGAIRWESNTALLLDTFGRKSGVTARCTAGGVREGRRPGADARVLTATRQTSSGSPAPGRLQGCLEHRPLQRESTERGRLETSVARRQRVLRHLDVGREDAQQQSHAPPPGQAPGGRGDQAHGQGDLSHAAAEDHLTVRRHPARHDLLVGVGLHQVHGAADGEDGGEDLGGSVEAHGVNLVAVANPQNITVEKRVLSTKPTRS